MNYKGMLLGRKTFETANGSVLHIGGFGAHQGGLPSGPVLECEGHKRWRIQLAGEGLPTSNCGNHESVDFFVIEFLETGILIFVADRFAYTLRESDGSMVGRARTSFVGKESLDFFRACLSSNRERCAVVSTRQVAVFLSTGEVLADLEIDGLVTDCQWTSPSCLDYHVKRLDGPQSSQTIRQLNF